MRGIEGAPLKYIIVGLALVLTISVLVTLVSGVKKSTNKTTEIMQKSMEETAKSMAKELGEMLGEKEKNVVKYLRPDEGGNITKEGVEFVIYNFEGGTVTVNITYANASSATLDWKVFAEGAIQLFNCTWTDYDEDGLADDFYCKAQNTTPIEYHYKKAIVRVSIIKDGKVISYDDSDWVVKS